MNEWNKAQAGYLYDANYDREVVENRTKCADLCYEFNQCKPSDTKKQAEIIKKIIGCIIRRLCNYSALLLRLWEQYNDWE